jgi:hypothetical protein
VCRYFQRVWEIAQNLNLKPYKDVIREKTMINLLKRARSLRNLSLNESQVSMTVFLTIKMLTKLQTLHLSLPLSFYEEATSFVPLLSTLTHVKRISLEVERPNNLDFLNNMFNLNELRLCRFPDCQMERIISVLHNLKASNLQSLHVIWSSADTYPPNLIPPQLSTLTELSTNILPVSDLIYFTNLRKLIVRGPPIVFGTSTLHQQEFVDHSVGSEQTSSKTSTSETFFDALRQFSRVEYLSLSFSDEFLASFSSLVNFNNLTTLNVSYLKHTPETCHWVGMIPNLQRLVLNHTKLSGDSLEQILSQCVTLKSLHMKWTAICFDK